MSELNNWNGSQSQDTRELNRRNSNGSHSSSPNTHNFAQFPEKEGQIGNFFVTPITNEMMEEYGDTENPLLTSGSAMVGGLQDQPTCASDALQALRRSLTDTMIADSEEDINIDGGKQYADLQPMRPAVEDVLPLQEVPNELTMSGWFRGNRIFVNSSDGQQGGDSGELPAHNDREPIVPPNTVDLNDITYPFENNEEDRDLTSYSENGYFSSESERPGSSRKQSLRKKRPSPPKRQSEQRHPTITTVNSAKKTVGRHPNSWKKGLPPEEIVGLTEAEIEKKLARRRNNVSVNLNRIKKRKAEIGVLSALDNVVSNFESALKSENSSPEVQQTLRFVFRDLSSEHIDHLRDWLHSLKNPKKRNSKQKR